MVQLNHEKTINNKMKKILCAILSLIFGIKLFGCNQEATFSLEERCSYFQSVIDSTKADQTTQELVKDCTKYLIEQMGKGIPHFQGYKHSNYKVYEGVIYNHKKDRAVLFVPSIFRNPIDKEKHIGGVSFIMVFKIENQWGYMGNGGSFPFTWYEGINLDDMVVKTLPDMILYWNLVYHNKLEIDYDNLNKKFLSDKRYKAIYDDMMKK